MPPKKILVVADNYHFSNRFISLLPLFRKNNIDIEFLCGDKLFTEKQKKVKGLLIKNISSYPNKNYLKILKTESPNMVIVLNINLLKNRVINRCCKFLNIPILFLDHGVTSVAGKTNSKRFDSNQALLKRYKRILGGELIKQYFSYFKYLISTKTSFKDYSLFIFESFFKLLGKDSFTEDWIYSGYCVCLESDKKKLLSQYKNLINKNKIFVIGNYDLNFFNLDYKKINSYNPNIKSKNILYFDSDCVFRTFNGKINSYLEYISDINRILKENGFKLKIKLHPNAINKKLHHKLLEMKISIIEQKDLFTNLLDSKYVISEPTSISALPCLIGLPILTPVLKPFNIKRYGIMIDEYPNRVNFYSINELENIIKEFNLNLDEKKIKDWIDKYAGPLPPADFPKRVFDVVSKII